MAGCRPRMPWGAKSINNRIESMTKILCKKLDLTDEQNEHLNIIKDEIKTRLLEQKVYMSKMLSVIQEEIRKDSVDKQRLEKLYDDRKQSRGELHEFILDKFVEFHAILTKEQRIKLNELIEQMMSRFNDK
jgi:periplasmic protein CpxP/Spy